MIETDLLKLLSQGSVSLTCLGVLVWIVVKQMPAQAAQFLAALEEERKQAARDREEDRRLHQELSNAIHGLALGLAAREPHNGLAIVTHPKDPAA